MFNKKINSTMKKLVNVIAVSLLLAACEKDQPLPSDQVAAVKRTLSESEEILKANLDQTASIVADIIQDETVLSELTLISQEGREFFSLSFRELFDGSKGVSAQFSTLRKRLLEECGSVTSKGPDQAILAEYLANNDCYLYCPYPSCFYPRGTRAYTVAAHPIDNDEENIGYRYEGKKKIEVLVNERYTDRYQVFLIMPKDEDKEDSKGFSSSPSKGDPVYEVRVGKIRCADYCGGLFEGTLELKVTRGFPEYNLTTEEIKASFSTVIPIDYPRDYAKAAINNWTIYCSGGWFNVNSIWDSNWKTSKTQQVILAYEYDKTSETSISATVGYKPDDLSTTLTATAKTTYKGELLGLVEWDRDWFYRTNTTPGPYDEMKDGWVVRKTCPVLKMTTPARTIN
jgi:hypothetical protein